MTKDGLPPPPPPPPAGGGDCSRRCSQCGNHGHNTRTCTARPPVKLFGVRIGDMPPMRKVVSMCNLAHHPEGSGGARAEECSGARAEGYGSEGEDGKPHRKRGEAWTEEEHKSFLLGLQNLGRGDWRGISRNYVTSRTPTQVASHAQKYFIRQTNNNRKKRSSLFDMVIHDSGDLPLSRSLSQEITLSRSSSQEVEEYDDDLQPVTAPVTALTSVSVRPPVAVMAPPAPVPVLTYAPAPAPVPAMIHQPEGSHWVCSSSNTGEAGMVMPQVISPYGYPMMFPQPQYAQAFYPVPYYGYAPMFYRPPGIMQASSLGTVQASHEPVRPVAVHSSPAVNVEDLYSMSELNLKGDSITNGVAQNSPLPPKPNGRPERQSAFHGTGSANGSSNGLIQAK